MSWSCKYHLLTSRLKVIYTCNTSRSVCKKNVLLVETLQECHADDLGPRMSYCEVGGKGKYSLNNQRWD